MYINSKSLKIICVCGIGITYSILEYWHYYKSVKRYNHYNNLRLPNIIPEDEMNKLVDVIINKNPKIFRRCQKFIYTKHIKNKTDLYNAFFIDTKKTEFPSNYMKVGSSELYWQYIPFCIDFIMKIIREIGNLYLSSIGFSRTWYNTKDGYYSIWTFHKKNTKPLIIFPGAGLGAIPYGKISKTFNRTVYIIEVPNLGYATPLSNSHCTSESLYDTISIHLQNNNPNYDTPPDILAHSLGSFHAAMYVNELYTKNITSQNQLLPKQNIVLCDPLSSVYDSINSHLYPFVDYCDYKTNIIRVNNKFEFYRYILLSHSLEFNSWCKRYHNLYNGTFWRDYSYSNIKYIYSKNDILMDSEYIIKQMNPTEYILNTKGKHGSCLFGKNSEIVRKQISDILNT